MEMPSTTPFPSPNNQALPPYSALFPFRSKLRQLTVSMCSSVHYTKCMLSMTENPFGIFSRNLCGPGAIHCRSKMRNETPATSGSIPLGFKDSFKGDLTFSVPHWCPSDLQSKFGDGFQSMLPLATDSQSISQAL